MINLFVFINFYNWRKIKYPCTILLVPCEIHIEFSEVYDIRKILGENNAQTEIDIDNCYISAILSLNLHHSGQKEGTDHWVSRCSTRHDWGIHCAQARKMKARNPPWLWNPGQTSSEVQNSSISGHTKETCVLQIFFKKKRSDRFIRFLFLSLNIKNFLWRLCFS